jgi:hypothetical protein
MGRGERGKDSYLEGDFLLLGVGVDGDDPAGLLDLGTLEEGESNAS